MGTRPPLLGNHNLLVVSPVWALFLSVSSQGCDKVNVHLKFPSLSPFTETLWCCEEVTGWEEGPGSTAARWDGNTPPWPMASARSHPAPWETLLMGCKSKGKDEGAGRSAWPRCRRVGWQAAHSSRSRLCGRDHPSVFSWATSHQPFPSLQSCHMLLGVRPWKKTEKQLSGRENHCEGWWWPLWKSFWTWQVFKLIFKHLFYTPIHVLTFNINCSFGCSLKQREEK